MSSLVIPGAVVLAIALALLLEARRRHTEVAHGLIKLRSEAAGLNEPPSLHPIIDPDICIGSAACVAACPEGKVLGVVDGRATLVMGSHCVGHGRCLSECPVGAIRLVFGTSERGVDIPHTSAEYESNVPGLYAVGELGGMGLVRNAVHQGTTAVRHILREDRARSGSGDVLDVAVVGAGPAGVAAAVTAHQARLTVRLFEREPRFGGAILHFPRHKLVLSEPMTMPGYGRIKLREIPKEQLLEILETALERAGVRVELGREVAGLRAEGEGAARLFRLRLRDGEEVRSRKVVLAIGRRGMPRKLGVSGEELAKVAYSLLEPEPYRGRHVLVVGGGNSAVEAAVMLAKEPGTEVTLSYRGQAFARVVEKNRAALEAAVAARSVRLLLGSQPTTIRETEVDLDTPAGALTLPNDFVFVFTGGVLPAEFLREAGVAVEKKFGEP